MDLARSKGTRHTNNYISTLAVVLIFSALCQAEDCYYKPCQEKGIHKKKCQFNIGCRMEGKFAKCNVSGMNIEKEPAIQTHTKCIAPDLVPGFTDFCKGLLNVNIAFPGPANNDNDKNVPEDDTTEETKSEVVVDNGNCFGTTILVSVATGCFLAGGFTVWLIMFCCRMSLCTQHAKNEEGLTGAGTDHSNWIPLIRERPIGSTSSAQLLTNASVESMSTNNTLLSAGESPTFNDTILEGHPSSTRHRESPATWTRPERQRYGHSGSTSAPWEEKGRPLLPRSRSAQWNDPRRSTLPHTPVQTSHWVSQGLMSLPGQSSQTASFDGHSHSAPWLDTIYSPASESSSRDYQSIQGGSENPYAPCSESSSDYSAPHTHRVMLIHDGEIYQPSSESSGSNNDYTSLKGQRFSRPNEGIYYPTSEGSNKDYASLNNEKDINAVEGSNNDACDAVQAEQNNNVSFNVSGLTFPVQASSRFNPGWSSNLHDINEYEIVDSPRRKDEVNGVEVNHISTLADLRDVNHNTEVSTQPHEYFTLEPLQNLET